MFPPPFTGEIRGPPLRVPAQRSAAALGDIPGVSGVKRRWGIARYRAVARLSPRRRWCGFEAAVEDAEAWRTGTTAGTPRTPRAMPRGRGPAWPGGGPVPGPRLRHRPVLRRPGGDWPDRGGAGPLGRPTAHRPRPVPPPRASRRGHVAV